MSLSVYLAFLLATLVVMVVPGPTNTLIVANSVRHGRRAGLLNVAGTQVGLALTVGLVLLGLTSLIAAMGVWFDWVRLAGAAYLIWLGWKLFTDAGAPDEGTTPRIPRGGFLGQGMMVELSNPKTLLFFGAFFPQFMDMSRNHTIQVLIMGVTAMAVAAISDSAYALLAARTAELITPRRARLMSRASGSVLIGGGLWLAFSRK
ncbi:MAG TPA: LysE family translocator [Rhizomicrobium sp.]|jgi:threonine/homoserine/homoserine lactone efflux protein|nr:LysE family translocator [Rhizomicrobium sp.]